MNVIIVFFFMLDFSIKEGGVLKWRVLFYS